MSDNHDLDGKVLVTLTLIVVSIFLLLYSTGIFTPTPPPPKIVESKPPIRAEDVGENLGSKTTRFGKGFVKGVWQNMWYKEKLESRD